MNKINRRLHFVLLGLILLLSVCGCSGRKDANSDIGDNQYEQRNYVLGYEIPDWFDASLLKSDIELYGISEEISNKSNGEDIIIDNIIEISGKGCYACCHKYMANDFFTSVAPYDVEKVQLGNALPDIPSGIREIGKIVDDADGLLLSDRDWLYIYNLSQNSLEHIISWSDFGLSGDDITAVYGQNDKIIAERSGSEGSELLIFSIESKEKPVEATDEKNVDEKETLVIATVNETTHLREAVYNYNKEDHDYIVEIVRYKGGDSDELNKLSLALSSDDSPDILDLTGLLVSFSDYVKNDYIIDLSPYIESSTEVDKGDYFEKALEIFSINGGLYSIPYSYNINTYIANDSEINPGYCFDDMIDYANRYPDAWFYNYNDKADIFYAFMQGNAEAFIDEEKGISLFDSEEFRKILEFSNTFPDEDSFKIPANASYWNALRDKSLLFFQYYMGSVYLIQKISGDIHFIGYPDFERKPKAYLFGSTSSASLSICANSKKNEAAWEFIEYYLNTPIHKADGMVEYTDGIPSKEENLELVLASLGDENSRYANMTVNDEKNHALTSKEREAFFELRDMAVPYPYEELPILQILEEESSSYFSGKKSVDDVIGIIQSRVQLYLDENLKIY